MLKKIFLMGMLCLGFRVIWSMESNGERGPSNREIKEAVRVRVGASSDDPKLQNTFIDLQNVQFYFVQRQPRPENITGRLADTMQSGIEGGVQQAFATVVAMAIIEAAKGAWHFVKPGPEQFAAQKNKELIEFAVQQQRYQLALQKIRSEIDELKRIVNDSLDIEDVNIKESATNAKKLIAELQKKQMALMIQGQILQEKAKEFKELMQDEEEESAQFPTGIVAA